MPSKRYDNHLYLPLRESNLVRVTGDILNDECVCCILHRRLSDRVTTVDLRHRLRSYEDRLHKEESITSFLFLSSQLQCDPRKTLNLPRILNFVRCRNDAVKNASELERGHCAWTASNRDTDKTQIGDAGSISSG